MSSQVQPIIDYLQQLQRKGETHVHLDDTARKIMREFFLVAKGYKKLTPSSEPQLDSEAESEPQLETESVSPPIAPIAPIVPQVLIQGATQQEKISSLSTQAANWPAATNLGTMRDKLVFSGGNPDADIMFISDTPGYFEETKGHPFAGPSGEKLDGILKAMGLKRSEVYITHLVKYRPSMPNQTTANRKPSAEEIEAFGPFIDAEIQVVNPKVIVALGSVVAHHLIDSSAPTDQLRGKFHQVSLTQVPVRVTYHPSYLLQNEAHADKRKLWEDMLSLMEKLEMPISEKQQRFFLSKS
ncbi:MAG: uracil-DNA glycosylase family 4 [Cryomorphaceae bacterium]|jgi:uracil-DNA glycosylase family 4